MSDTTFVDRVTTVVSSWLNDVNRLIYDIKTSIGSSLVGFLAGGSGSTATTVQVKLRQTLSVWDKMTPEQIADCISGANPTLDTYAAFAAAWAYVKATGGTLLIPQGNYLLSATWVCDVDQSLPHNYEISGYGATLFATSAVTGFAVRVYKGYNNFGVKIEGLQFNHRNNTTVAGCIQAQGVANLRIVKCVAEAHNSKAGYAAVELGAYTAGDGNTNTFWTLIDGFTIRQRSGGDGTLAAIGVRLAGVANATKILNCQFSSVVDAIRFDTDGVAISPANGVVILHNDFEGVTNAITFNTAAPLTVFATGVRIAFNRVESTTTFINITGAAVTDSGYPPIVENNYLTVGSVTNYLVNPNSQLIWTWEPSYYGVGSVKNTIGGQRSMQFQLEGTGNNLELVRQYGGSGSYAMAHLVMCANHLWFENSTGRLWANNVQPTTATDGTPIGYESITVPTIGSAASIVIPIGANSCFVSGVTGITSITAPGRSNATITLIFQGILTVTDGGNLKLAGNFVTTADDTLTLTCDGTNWYEVARSVN